MNATRLYHENGTPTDAFYCTSCGSVKPSSDKAEACCRPILCECGEPVLPYYPTCDSCRSKNYRERATVKEAERFEKATKIPAKGYEGWVYCEGGDSGDSYYPSIDDLIDDLVCNDLQGEVIYAWACTSHQIISVDIDSILDNCCDSAYEDWEHDGSGLVEFREAIKVFEEASNTPQNTAWEIDYSRAVMLDFEPIEESS